MTEKQATPNPGAPEPADILNDIKRDVEDVKHAIDDLKPYVRLVKELEATLQQDVGRIGELGTEGLHQATQALDHLSPTLIFRQIEQAFKTVRAVADKGLTFEGSSGADQKKKFLCFAQDFPESLTNFRTVMAKEIPGFDSTGVRQLLGVVSDVVGQLGDWAKEVPAEAWAPLRVVAPFFLFYQARDQFDHFVNTLKSNLGQTPVAEGGAVAPPSTKQDVEIALYLGIVSVSAIVQVLGYFEGAFPMGLGVSVAGGGAAGLFGAAGGSYQPVNVTGMFVGAFRTVFSVLLTALQYFPVDLVAK